MQRNKDARGGFHKGFRESVEDAQFLRIRTPTRDRTPYVPDGFGSQVTAHPSQPWLLVGQSTRSESAMVSGVEKLATFSPMPMIALGQLRPIEREPAI